MLISVDIVNVISRVPGRFSVKALFLFEFKFLTFTDFMVRGIRFYFKASLNRIFRLNVNCPLFSMFLTRAGPNCSMEIRSPSELYFKTLRNSRVVRLVTGRGSLLMFSVTDLSGPDLDPRDTVGITLTVATDNIHSPNSPSMLV